MTDWKIFLQNKKISIIVPVYNEAPFLEKNISMLRSEVEPYLNNFEIIIINDGSTDESFEILSKIKNKNIKILNLELNKGKGYALRKSLEQACGELILFIDGGMELHPKEIRVFIALQDIYQADIVIGSKRHPQSIVYYPLSRRFLSLVYQGLIKWLFDLRITDTQVGLKLLRADVVRTVLPKLKTNSYAFDLELLVKANHLGFKTILEAPIELDYFSKRRRPPFLEFFHVSYISILLFLETIQIYLDVRKENNE